MAWIAISLGAVVLVAGIVGALVFLQTLPRGGGGPSAPAQPPAASDVQVTACHQSEFGTATATIRVTNSTTRKRDYIVSLAYRDSSGTRLATGTVFLNAVSAGESAQDDDIAFVSGGGQVHECVVTAVTRL